MSTDLRTQLDTKTIYELRTLCKRHKIRGVSGKNKSQLIQLIQSKRENVADLLLLEETEQTQATGVSTLAIWIPIFAGVIATLVGAWTFFNNRQIQSNNTMVLVDTHLHKAWDLLGGKSNASRINRYTPDHTQREAALRHITAAMSLDPDYAEVYTVYGTYFLSTKQWDKAIERFQKAIDLSPGEAHIYLNLGDAYFNNGDREKALNCFNDAIDLDRDYSEAYNSRGLVYIYGGNTSKAIVDFSKAIDLAPDEIAAYNNRGICYAMAGNYMDASVDFSKAIQLSPGDAFAYYNQACIFALRSQTSSAVELLRMSFERDSTRELVFQSQNDPSFEKISNEKEFVMLISQYLGGVSSPSVLAN